MGGSLKRPTLHDVAHLARVRYVTADRVVNRRGNVAEKSIRKVRMAVDQLGYVRNAAAAKLSRNRSHRFVFVLPQKAHLFFGRMHDQVRKAQHHARAVHVYLDIIEFEIFERGSLDTALAGDLDQDYAGGAFVGQSHREPSGSVRSLRENGFKDVLSTDFPAISISDLIETRDQDQAMRDARRTCLSGNDAVTAIYNAGAAKAGLIDALRMIRPDGFVFTVVHELSDRIRGALEDGIIDLAIDQQPEVEINRAFTLLQALADDRPPPPPPELIPALYVRDNLPNEASIT